MSPWSLAAALLLVLAGAAPEELRRRNPCHGRNPTSFDGQ